ncbi:MAG TPA: hypothetical protein VER08_02615 [Pyrinomonadaceae bacterium]|nr:hypothetical protein [Pyrinomonadaceae bacterium]
MPPKQDKKKVPRRSAGLVITPPAPRPVEDNPAAQLFREAKEAERAAMASTSAPLLPPPTTSYHQPPPSTQNSPELPVAPQKDFTKVPNSVTRDAVPAGLFKGTSKKLYDALYQRTRGAVQPTRQLKARQSDLMMWARVSHNTLRAHLRHLEAVGLVVIRWGLGDNDGAVYEVFTPEEILSRGTSPHLPPPPPTSTQFLVGPSTQFLVGGGGGQTIENTDTYESPKTLIKTDEEIDDDEAFAGLSAALKQAVKEITGKGPSAAEAERWRELADVLVTELKIAAGRTNVSSVPSFFAEHLRRRLFKKDRAQLAREEKSGPEAPVRVDAAKCPDCFGTGMWYPEGYEKGVAKCRHEKLVDTPAT